MSNLILFGNVDIAILVFYAFVLFFIGLVIYLRREDRREGYPLEHEITGQMESAGGPFLTATTKFFKLPFDRGTVSAPTQGREPVNIAARRIDRFAGAPYAPTGDALADGVGPAAWAERAKVPDLDHLGRPRIVPMASDPDFTIARKDPDIRGYRVVAADRRYAGTVSDVWVDRSEHIIRYLSVDLGDGRTVVAPMAMASVDARRKVVHIDAINADRYAGVPALASPTEITRYEEERVIAYFGGGYLYSNKDRQEPWL